MISIKGGAKLNAALAKIGVDVSRVQAQALEGGAAIVQGDAIKSINRGAKTGRLYPRGNNQFHQASAPGEAPANDSDSLSKSIQVDKVSSDEVRIGSHLPYSRVLELEMDRPFMMPALERNRKKILAQYKRLIARAIDV